MIEERTNTSPAQPPLLTFMNGCLPRTPLRTLVPALSDAGFRAMTIWPNVWRHARRRDGMSLRDMRALLDDHGIRLTDVDAYRDWVPAPADAASSALGAEARLEEFLETCAELGGTTLVAVHLGQATDLAQEVDGFAALCEAASQWGLRVALEFLAFGGVKDAGHAWRIVESARQPNAGLVVDLWHQLLGAGSDDPALLDRVPAGRIFTVQIADAPYGVAVPDLHDAMYGRLLPGDGVLDIADCWRAMRTRGAAPAIGIEVFRECFNAHPVDHVVQMLASRTQAFIAASG